MFTKTLKLSWGGDPFEINYKVNAAGNELHFHITYLGDAPVVGHNSKKCHLIYRIGTGKVLSELPLVFDASGDSLSIDVFWDQALLIKLEDKVTLKSKDGPCRCHKFTISNSLSDQLVESFDFPIKNGQNKIGGVDPELAIIRQKIQEDYKEKALRSINELISDPLGEDALTIERITLRATLRKGLNLLKETLYKVNTEAETTFTISLLNDGVWIESRPLLKIDTVLLLPNAYLRSIYFDFKSGKVEKVNIRSDKKGLLFFGGKKVEKQVEKAVLKTFDEMMENTMLDPAAQGSLLPYNPFNDKNFRTNLAKFQKQIVQNMSSGNDAASPIGVEDVLRFSLGGNLIFENDFAHDLGPAQILIPKDTKISSNVVVKSKLATVIENPFESRIDRIELRSEGIALGAKGAVQAMFKEIDILHGGLVKVRKVEIHNEIVKNMKLGLVLVKLLLISASARMGTTVNRDSSEPVLANSLQTTALELAFKEFLLMTVKQNYALAKSYGLDLKKALGIEE